MTELELKEYLIRNYPQENEDCEWKEYSNLKHVVKGHEGDDIVRWRNKEDVQEPKGAFVPNARI